jgi:CheY-like chemotaxis protein
MPGGINGIELGRQARQLRQDIKVLLTSGYAAAMAEGQVSAGFAVLGKPYRQVQLAETIANALRQRG